MEAVIKVKVSELNASLLKRIKKLFSEKEDAERSAWAAPGVVSVESTLELEVPEYEYEED